MSREMKRARKPQNSREAFVPFFYGVRRLDAAFPKLILFAHAYAGGARQHVKQRHL